ncbi:MAG: hypothetical protein Q9161_004280 [Pseudevernia consocians]
MLGVLSNYHDAGSEKRYYRRLVGTEIASADAMAALLLADADTNTPGVSKSDRPQQDTASPEKRYTSVPRAIRFKVSPAFRLRTVKEALATLKLPHIAKETSTKTARELEDAALCRRDVKADEFSLAMPQRDGCQHTPGQESDPSASSSRGIGFKKTWERCVEFLQKLSQEAVGWANLSEPAGEYFHHIAAKIEGYNISLYPWGSYDLEIRDPRFGDSSPSELIDYVTRILEEIISSGEGIRKEMEFLGSLACQGLVVHTTGETGVLGSVAGHEHVEEDEEEMERVGSLAEQQTPGGLGLNMARKLQTSTSKIDTESKKIALDVTLLVVLREAMRCFMYQAIEYQYGPLAGHRQDILAIRNEVETRKRLQKRMREIDLSEPAIPGPVRRSTSSWSSEGDDDNGHIPTSNHGILDRR